MGYKKVCFSCKKAFNLDSDVTIQYGNVCPECGSKTVGVNQKFRPPKKSSINKWRVAQFLIENGFIYHHVYESIQEPNQHQVKRKAVEYPDTLKEAKLFVEKYKQQAIKS